MPARVRLGQAAQRRARTQPLGEGLGVLRDSAIASAACFSAVRKRSTPRRSLTM